MPFILKEGLFREEGTIIYYQDTETHTFRAYYPYNAAGGVLTATTDAAAQQDQSAIDFLFASGATGSTQSPEVSFTDKNPQGETDPAKDHAFHHCMSQITLTFKAGSGVDFSQVKPEGYKLGEVKLIGTFDTTDGTATADAEAQAGELVMELKNGNLTSSVILFPQTAASLPLVVKYNDQEYQATLTVPDGALKAGNNYTYTVKVNNKELTLDGCEIGDWADGGSQNGEAVDLGYAYDTDTKTYTVYTPDGLLIWNKAVQSDLTLNCTLASNIDITGKEWTPVGNEENPYTGTFNGNGHTITGLTLIQEGVNYVGMIGHLGSDGKVQELTLENVHISGHIFVGGVAGLNSGNLNACTVSGDVSGGGDAGGGIVGQNNGIVSACTVSGTVSGESSIGGVVGRNSTSGTVIACYRATGSVAGEYYVGGVAGSNSTSASVTACYHATGSVSGRYYIGGIVGSNSASVTDCYWSDSPDTGIGSGNGETTKVDDTTVTWQDAVDAMNTLLQNAGSVWRYELTGELPTLEQQ